MKHTMLDEQDKEDIIADINKRIPFNFGIDENGNYGYYKEGETTLIPFSGGSSDTIPTFIKNVMNDENIVKTYAKTASLTCETDHYYLLLLGYMTEPSLASIHSVSVTGADIVGEIKSTMTGQDGSHVTDIALLMIKATQTDVTAKLLYNESNDIQYQTIIAVDVTDIKDDMAVENFTVVNGKTANFEENEYYLIFVSSIIGNNAFYTLPSNAPIYYETDFVNGADAYSHHPVSKLLMLKPFGTTKLSINSTAEKNCLYYIKIS